jgi:hypothetical protein
MKKLFTLSFTLLLFGFYQAQNYVDLARIHYSTTPLNEFDSINGNTNIQDMGIDITLPIKLNDSNAILTGLNLDQNKTKFHPLGNYQTVSTINLKVGFNKKHSKKWAGTYMLLPKISSDFKNISDKDFQLGALIIMKYNKKENLKYNIGLYYNNELFGPFFVPLLGLYYKSSNNKFEANFTLPIWADMNYRLTNWLNIGTNFSAFVRSYHLSENNTYVVKKSNEIFGYLQFTPTKSIIIQTKTGYSLGRSYKVYNDNDKTDIGISAFRFGDERAVLNPIFKDGLIFKFRLIYRFHL